MTLPSWNGFCWAPKAAVVLLLGSAAGCGTWAFQAELLIRVVDERTGRALPGATVQADYLVRRTGPSGKARFVLRPATYNVMIEHPAFAPMEVSVVLTPNAVAAKTVGLQPRPRPSLPSPVPSVSASPGASPASPQPSEVASAPADAGAVVFGRVTDEAGNRVSGAYLLLESNWGVPLGEARTNAVGEFKVAQLPKGQSLKLTVLADGFKSVTRHATPVGEWRLDFTGLWSLRKDLPPSPVPGGPPVVRVEGVIQDTSGRSLSGAFVRVESDNVRYPLMQVVAAPQGSFELKLPAEIPVRFTATKPGYRPVTFVERLELTTGGGPLRLDFSAGRALAPLVSSGVRGE